MVTRTIAWVSLVLMVLGCEAGAEDWGSGRVVDRSPGDDWAFEPSEESFHRMDGKRGDFACAKLGDYVSANDPWAAFFAVRDAGLFGDKGCFQAIATYEAALSQRADTSAAVAFYRARMGEPAGLTSLLAMFDEQAIQPGSGSLDHVAVSLFGFFPDWDRTGRRLLRHAKHADGAAMTMNGNALVWKKHLYGNSPTYRADCAKAAKLEDVAMMETYLCDPPTPDL